MPQDFDAVYERFAPVVHGICLAHAGPEDAEDLTQDVFLKVHAKLENLREPDALPGWICTLARNHVIDHLRGRGREPARIELGERPARGEGNDGAELRARVFACVARLPETYRETLTLRLAEGLSGPEIAERTGMTKGSVRVNLHRGMALLRPMLARAGWS